MKQREWVKIFEQVEMYSALLVRIIGKKNVNEQGCVRKVDSKRDASARTIWADVYSSMCNTARNILYNVLSATRLVRGVVHRQDM